MSTRSLLVASLITVLTACGGGGGGGSANPPPTSITPPPAAQPPTQSELQAAAKFLSLATFGPTLEEIESVAESGTNDWLDTQFAMAPSRHLPIVVRYIDEYGFDFQTMPIPSFYRRFAFYEQALTANDQLRQLVAYALSQIFVVSDNVGALNNDPSALASYYDMLMEQGFGNYRDLLLAVTLHPAMGLYLSHVNNGKSDPLANTFPDENYAREVMQLFSIGLFELNPDGSVVQDSSGNPIPTYDNADIREFSKIFTGLSYGPREPGGPSFFGNGNPVLHVPMVMFDDFHEPGSKSLLNGLVVPDGQDGMADIEAAIENLFNHPNVGPFIGKQLIQRLVTSNPSPAYVTRVTQAFNGDQSGVRGDMTAVIRAILTDPEVDSAIRLREPFRRYLAINRSLQARGEDGTVPGLGFVAAFLTQQHVFSSPSVFNFYLPSFSPAGPVQDAGLVAPEFQITNASTVIGITNLIAYTLFNETSIDSPEELADITLNLDDFLPLVGDGQALVDQINLVFFAGDMDEETESILVTYADDTFAASSDDVLTLRATLYLALATPAYAVSGEM
ncbi:MAG: DUF1800 domain-containing protein [Pseudomonadota bacterium]